MVMFRRYGNMLIRFYFNINWAHISFLRYFDHGDYGCQGHRRIGSLNVACTWKRHRKESLCSVKHLLYLINSGFRTSYSPVDWLIIKMEFTYTSRSLILMSRAAFRPVMHALYSALLLVHGNLKCVVTGSEQLSGNSVRCQFRLRRLPRQNTYPNWDIPPLLLCAE